MAGSFKIVQRNRHTYRSFSQKELYSLSSQIKRAADSVVLNIADGSTGQSKPEFKKIYE